jgi:hypothetical protein
MQIPFSLILVFQAALISYVISSPFLFLWFHKVVMKETWNNDLADRVTVKIYIISNIAAAAISYLIQECRQCQ